jgi:hypothetical protein
VFELLSLLYNIEADLIFTNYRYYKDTSQKFSDRIILRHKYKIEKLKEIPRLM